MLWTGVFYKKPVIFLVVLPVRQHAVNVTILVLVFFWGGFKGSEWIIMWGFKIIQSFFSLFCHQLVVKAFAFLKIWGCEKRKCVLRTVLWDWRVTFSHKWSQTVRDRNAPFVSWTLLTEQTLCFPACICVCVLQTVSLGVCVCCCYQGTIGRNDSAPADGDVCLSEGCGNMYFYKLCYSFLCARRPLWTLWKKWTATLPLIKTNVWKLPLWWWCVCFFL